MVSNFVAMVTGIGRGRIGVTSFNSLTQETTVLHARTSVISVTQTAISLTQISLSWHQGSCGVNFYDTVKLATPKTMP